MQACLLKTGGNEQGREGDSHSPPAHPQLLLELSVQVCVRRTLSVSQVNQHLLYPQDVAAKALAGRLAQTVPHTRSLYNSADYALPCSVVVNIIIIIIIVIMPGLALCRPVLCCIVVHCVVLHCIALHCTMMCQSALYCSTLH